MQNSQARGLVVFVALLWTDVLYAQNFVRVTPATIATDRTDTWGASWVDYDGDGDQDLFLSNVFSNNLTPTNLIYRNDGDGVFAQAPAGGG